MVIYGWTVSEARRCYLECISRFTLERNHIIHLKTLPNLDAIHRYHRLWTVGQRHR